jgi:hypothetical protein
VDDEVDDRLHEEGVPLGALVRVFPVKGKQLLGSARDTRPSRKISALKKRTSSAEMRPCTARPTGVAARVASSIEESPCRSMPVRAGISSPMPQR